MSLLQVGRNVGAVKRWAGPLVNRFSHWLAGNSSRLASAGTALGLKAGSTKKQILEYVRKDPMNSILALYMAVDTVDFALELMEANPDLARALELATGVDNLETLRDPAKAEEILKKKVEVARDVSTLTLAEIERFKDEKELIERVISYMPGSTFESRYERLLELRKVLTASHDTFAIFDRVRALSE